MATYTVTTTAEQEVVLADFVAAENARRIADGSILPPINAEEGVQLRVDTWLTELVEDETQQLHATLMVDVDAATPEQQTAIRALLDE